MNAVKPLGTCAYCGEPVFPSRGLDVHHLGMPALYFHDTMEMLRYFRAHYPMTWAEACRP